MPSDCCPVCLSVLSVTLVHCGQTVKRIKVKLGMQVGLCLGHIVLNGDPAPPKGRSPQFSAHVYCGQTVVHLSHSMLSTCYILSVKPWFHVKIKLF